ncbi:uncharacterized protein LOC117640321 [Thrips palmi]|uniref:Regulatory protein zeste n=1 Tax=Thrips palmi TaxID=161013 RepID=A0A6P8Y919_THRPL|nr:uncharacterized protein LOC117640321 [Thrips palmi]
MQPTKKKRFMEGAEDCRKGSSSMSEKQRNVMLEFLSENPSMIRDRSVGGTSNRPNRDELWEKLATVLNSCGSGAQKDGAGWRRSWQDLKRYESLKAKESMARLGKSSECQESPTISLSPLQEKIATLLNISIKVSMRSLNLSQTFLTDMHLNIGCRNSGSKKLTNNTHLKVFITFFIQTLQQNSICETIPTGALNIHSF